MRRPAEVDAGQLVARFGVDADSGIAAIVTTEKQIDKRVQIARTGIAAPLRRSRQTDLERRHRFEVETHSEELRVGHFALFFELPEHHAEIPGSEPAEPLRLECVGEYAVDRQRRDRPRVVRQDQAAVPARPPPALQRARRNRPVADDDAEQAVVGTEFVSVLCRVNELSIEVGAEPVADPGETRRYLATAARRVLKRADAGRVIGEADFGIERQLGGAGLPVRTLFDAGERVCDRGRQIGRVSVADVVEDRTPGERPGGDRALDEPKVGQALDVVAQREVAGRDVGAGEYGSGIQESQGCQAPGQK